MSEITKNGGARAADTPCRCGSGVSAESCCLRLIQGQEKAQTAEQLMRSRFVAYATGQKDYVRSSWHSSTRPAELEMPADLLWTGLQVIRHRPQGEDRAEVEFIASFVAGSGPGQMHELSRFVKEAGQWFYVDGDQIDDGASRTRALPGRNDPCYCGSGKKFKKCCGRSQA